MMSGHSPRGIFFILVIWGYSEISELDYNIYKQLWYEVLHVATGYYNPTAGLYIDQQCAKKDGEKRESRRPLLLLQLGHRYFRP